MDDEERSEGENRGKREERGAGVRRRTNNETEREKCAKTIKDVKVKGDTREVSWA